MNGLGEKAVSARISTKEKAAALTEEGRLNLIFAPGLSTARQITSVSGRGVGLDVVQSNIERIGGLISLDNRPGRGLSIILRVPLTLTIIHGLILRSGGQHFAIPRAAVLEMLRENNQILRISTATR